MFGETPRPYDMQNHIYDRNTEYTHMYVKELRKVLDSYPERAMVGEIQVQGRGQMEQSASYMGENNDELQMCFEFSLMKQRLNAKNMRAVARRWYELCSLEKGRVPCWVLSNHDNPRAITRAGGDENYARLLAMYLILQRGAGVVYYGEEIGMQSKDFPRKEIQDPVGKRYWPVEKGRDGERRPMQWDCSENMGFSKAKPWLEPNYSKDWRHCTVENQEADISSLLNLYRALIRLKKERPEIAGSDAVFTEKVPSGILAWSFEKDGKKTAVILNMSGKTRTVRLDDIQGYAQGMKIRLFSNARVNSFIRRSAEGDSIMLPMHYGVVLTN